jgi:hypothetical protein
MSGHLQTGRALMLERPSALGYGHRMRIAPTKHAVAIAFLCITSQHPSVAQSTNAPTPSPQDLTPESCRQQLEAQHATFVFAPPVTEGDCTIPLSVKLQALSAGDNTVTFTAQPLLDCPMAIRLADWIANVAEPLAHYHLGSGLKAIETGPGYACRNQNNAAAGKLSEHAKGNAIDIAAFALREGGRIAVRPPDQPAPAVANFLAAIRTTACGYFFTTLGPGSDAAHAEHLHLDLRARASAYRICQ